MKPSAVNDSFCKYGSVYYEPIDLEQQHLLCRQFSTDQKSVSQLFCFPCEFTSTDQRACLVVVSAQEDCGEPSTFAIHHYLRLRPGTAFNILSRSDQTAYCIITTDRRLPRSSLPSRLRWRSRRCGSISLRSWIITSSRRSPGTGSAKHRTTITSCCMCTAAP